VKSGGRLRVTGLEIRGAVGLYSDSGSAITVSTAMRFGGCAAYQMYASLNGTIKNDVAAYTICGTGAIDHLALDDGGIVVLTSTTVSFVGCPAFSGAFASANGPGACLRYFLNTFSYPTVTISIASPRRRHLHQPWLGGECAGFILYYGVFADRVDGGDHLLRQDGARCEYVHRIGHIWRVSDPRLEAS